MGCELSPGPAIAKYISTWPKNCTCQVLWKSPVQEVYDRTQHLMGMFPSLTGISETRSSAAASRALPAKQESRRPGPVLLVTLLLYCHHVIYLPLDLPICKISSGDTVLKFAGNLQPDPYSTQVSGRIPSTSSVF